jgi:hypothetical protein
MVFTILTVHFVNHELNIMADIEVNFNSYIGRKIDLDMLCLHTLSFRLPKVLRLE